MARVSNVVYVYVYSLCHLCFFFNDTATTEIYTLSLHDALPIYNIHPLFAGAPKTTEFRKLRKRIVRNVREAVDQ